jgi:hypothetical protein
MLVKVVAYIMLYNISLYHASRTFKLVNTSSLQEHAFILNNVKALKALFLDSIYKFVLCSSIIDKYIKKYNSLSNIFVLNLLQIMT